MKESDLFEPLKQFLLSELGFNKVYAEVGTKDIIGLKGNDVYGIEMKKNLNFKVMEQAEYNLKSCDYSYIAVPKPKKKHSAYIRNLLKDRGLGLIYVGTRKVEVVHLGKKSLNKTYDIRNSIDEDYHSRTIGGVKNGDIPSRYSEMIADVKSFMVEFNDWVSVSDILDNVEKCNKYYARPRPSLMSTLRESWNLGWCESKKEGRNVYFRYK